MTRTGSLSGAQARAMAIAAQGLTARPRATSPTEVLERIGAIQLDTISVLARSHELVPQARLHQTDRSSIEAALWSDPPRAFEYWSHAACLLPLADYPLFAFRRRAFRRRGIRWHEVPSARVLAEVTARLADGPATASELGGAKRGGEWWDWSQTKVAVEWLLDIGDVVCVKRVGWRRVYQLAGSVLTPATHRDWVTADGVYGPTDSDCVDRLLLRSVDSLGVGTVDDIIDVHRLTGHGVSKASLRTRLESLAHDGRIARTEVRDWSEPAYQTHLVDEARSTTTMLSPFDSLVWRRERVKRMFGLDFRLEAYTPAQRRVHGYFAMPVLHNNALVALVDPGRERTTAGVALVAKQVTFPTEPTPTAITGTARALQRAARWVDADLVRVGRVVPASAAAALRQALNATGLPRATKPKS